MYDLQAISDYLEIRDLSARLNRLADLGDGENSALLFTDDGEFDVRGNYAYRGQAQIAAVVGATKVVVHVTADPVIEIDGDTAKQTSRMITFLRVPDNSRVELVSTGLYIDDLRRTDDGWRFSRRRVEVDLEFDAVLKKVGSSETLAKLTEASDSR